MEYKREPTIEEIAIIKYLILKSQLNFPANWQIHILVKPLDDGGMGSLRIIPKGVDDDDRMFGKQISEFEFKDVDNVSVLVSLYIDNKGQLFELDIWKVNFGKLIRFPDL